MIINKADKLQIRYSSYIKEKTEIIYNNLKDIYSDFTWTIYAPYIYAINLIKFRRNAIILSHNYQPPEIYRCVADIVGDSLSLALKTSVLKYSVIVQCGVYFMAETAKIVNPNSIVLIPNKYADCSLASSIGINEILFLRRKFPGVPIVCYINTTVEIKAYSDICCTSSNVLKIVTLLKVKSLLLIPDEHLAINTSKHVKFRILRWRGSCEVHKRFSETDIIFFKKKYPLIKIIAHSECMQNIIKLCDFIGSTSEMIEYLKNVSYKYVLLVTECSMVTNIQNIFPKIKFIKPCNICPYMRKISLPLLLVSLLKLRYEINISPELLAKAKSSIENMFNLIK